MRVARVLRQFVALSIFISFLYGVLLSLSDMGTRTKRVEPPSSPAEPASPADPVSPTEPVISWRWDRTSERDRLRERRKALVIPRNVSRTFSVVEDSVRLNAAPDRLLNYNVHLFYYAGYGNPHFDGGEYVYWNHRYVEHWDKFQRGRHQLPLPHNPPTDIAASFYPALGIYSSRDPDVIATHMEQIRVTGAGVLVVSWYPPHDSDDYGKPVDPIISQLLDAADKQKLKVCLQIEAYRGRNANTVQEDIKYVVTRYGRHPAFYRRLTLDHRSLPFFYIYDSYLTEDWRPLLGRDGTRNRSNTPYDAIFIGLLAKSDNLASLVTAGFDGAYTFFVSDGASYGADRENWVAASDKLSRMGMLFIPTVGPGYCDEHIRPWNARSTVPRIGGTFYESKWGAAVDVDPAIITVASFNGWHIGTQIEPAVPAVNNDTERQYNDYAPKDPNYYLELTHRWVQKFRESQRKRFL